jgi:glutathione S-transferase
MQLVFDRLEKSPMPFFVRPVARALAGRVKKGFIEPNLQRQLEFMEGELARSAWFAGDEFSAADVQMSFPLEAAAVRGGLGAKQPRLMAFLGRIRAREAYRRALERGGEFSILS